MRLRSWLVLVCVAIAVPASAQRLPDTAEPLHYQLWFAPDLVRETFEGRTTIDIRIKSATDRLILHAAELAIKSATLVTGGRSRDVRVTPDATTETITVDIGERLEPGPATLRFEYSGTLNDQLRGFYISRANNRKYAVTQMEATDARRAFPSFDEPALKATFDISLQIAKDDTAISNGRVVSDTPGPVTGTHTVRFSTTPRMSTYLVAMIVGDFVCREGSADGTAIRICSTPDKRALTGFALDAARQQLAFFNDYFGIRYPFGKLDVIAVPDFAAGAMENAGAITFRERLLLVDPDHAPVETRKRVASVLSHEIAHQWFGNLVTMRWWDDIWLNEGFATWMSGKPLAKWQPSWRMELDGAAATQEALAIDALRTTRAIRTRAETPQEINELFDAIAYSKTAAVLRMIESYVGEDTFRRAVGSYLRKHAFANATGEDFWTEVTKVSGKPVDRIMRTFVDQPGAPVLAAAAVCGTGSGRLTVTQAPFTTGAAGAAPRTWTFPACTRPTAGQARCDLVDEVRETWSAASCPVLLNAQARGYYFSQYTPDDLRAISAGFSRLPPVERLGLLGDEWWMMRSGRHDADVYLGLAEHVAASESATELDMLASRLTEIARDLVTPADRGRFEAWIRARFGPALERIGLSGRSTESDDLNRRRSVLMRLVGSIGNDTSVQAHARDRALAYLSDRSSLSPALASTVLEIAAIRGGPDLYERYVTQLPRVAAQPDEYYRVLNALPRFADQPLVTRTLELALSDQIRSQDMGALIAGVLATPWGRDIGWSFVQSRWDTLAARLGVFQGIPTIVTAVGNLCSTQAAGEVRQFFAAHPVPSSERTIAQTVERIESCAAMRERQTPSLTRWLAASPDRP